MGEVKYYEIVDDPKWDGNQSKYKSARSFARASLLNFNTLAGREKESWVKRLVYLPVRRDKDDSDTFVKQAVLSASKKIARLTKPDEISEEDFLIEKSRAANEIVHILGQMGEEVSDEVMDLQEKNRAKSMYSIYDRLYEAVQLADMAEGTYTYIIDMYMDENGLFALGIRDGNIIRIDIVISGDQILLSDIVELDVSRTAERKTSTIVKRQADGRYRFLVIASTSALNRSGEIDSKELFDSFKEMIHHTGEHPILNFYHQGANSRLGVADWVDRSDNVYMASGYFDDTEFGQKAARGLMKDPSYWGISIEFLPLEGEIIDIDVDGTNISIPVFNRGINTALSILPEKSAAALFTYHANPTEEPMDTLAKEALRKLYDGDEELVDQFEAVVDGANREVQKRIHRTAEVEDVEEVEAIEEEVVVEEEILEEVEEEVVDEEAEEVVEEEILEDETEIVLDESVIPSLAAALMGDINFVRAVQQIVIQESTSTAEGMAKLGDTIERTVSQWERLEQRVSDMESKSAQADEEWEEDVPTSRKKNLTYRARETSVPAEQAEASLADTASATLASIYETG